MTLYQLTWECDEIIYTGRLKTMGHRGKERKILKLSSTCYWKEIFHIFLRKWIEHLRFFELCLYCTRIDDWKRSTVILDSSFVNVDDHWGTIFSKMLWNIKTSILRTMQKCQEHLGNNKLKITWWHELLKFSDLRCDITYCHKSLEPYNKTFEFYWFCLRMSLNFNSLFSILQWFSSAVFFKYICIYTREGIYLGS